MLHCGTLCYAELHCYTELCYTELVTLCYAELHCYTELCYTVVHCVMLSYTVTLSYVTLS